VAFFLLKFNKDLFTNKQDKQGRNSKIERSTPWHAEGRSSKLTMVVLIQSVFLPSELGKNSILNLS
jgi:hypothetical protein